MINAENSSRLFPSSEAVEAGGWRAELRNDELADISFNGTPVLRAIRAVVRDHDWRTLVPTVRRAAHRDKGDGTSVLLDIDFDGSDASYTGELAIHFKANSLKVTFDGVAPAAFRSNRIGLVVLHRPDDAGRAVTIGSPSGGRTPSTFPVDISPYQPFLDIASMEWERDGIGFQLRFSGDVFETEDQRNWTDASFKTYSTPLSKPFPVEVPAGNRVHQSVLLTANPTAAEVQATSAASPAAASQGAPVLTVLDGAAARVPALSISATSGSGELLGQRIPGLEALLVELHSGTDAESVVRSAVEQATVLGVPLDVRLEVPSTDRVSGLLDLLPLENVVRLGIFDAVSRVTESGLWTVLEEEARRRGFTGALMAGASSDFIELNRNADRLPKNASALTFSITPQKHTTEIPHIVETLPIQRLTALNALRIGSGRPLHVGPVTLKPRFNALASSGEMDAAAGMDAAGLTDAAEAEGMDPLQPEPFTAAWLLGSIAALSIPGVESVSYFEASGPRGISGPGGLTPAGEVLAALAGLHGADVLEVDGSVPGLVLYPVRDGARTVLFAANLTPDRLSATVRLPLGLTHDGEANLELEAWTAVVHPLD